MARLTAQEIVDELENEGVMTVEYGLPNGRIRLVSAVSRGETIADSHKGLPYLTAYPMEVIS